MFSRRILAVFAALNGALAVAIGAFAAHGVAPDAGALLGTGAHYQLVHALLALVCAGWSPQGRDRRIMLAGWLAAAGGLIFAGALSLIALAGLTVMGMVAPVGGTLMVAGWLLLAYAVLRPHSLND